MCRLATAVVLLAVGTLSCASSNHNLPDPFRPVASGDCKLEVRSHPYVLAAGAELLARYVLTNVSAHGVRGCVSVDRQWTFAGAEQTLVVEQTATHQLCLQEGELLLAAGEEFTWLDAVTVPDVGAGDVQVAVEIDLVPLNENGQPSSDNSATVRHSFSIRLEAAADGEHLKPSELPLKTSITRIGRPAVGQTLRLHTAGETAGTLTPAEGLL